MLFIIDLYTEYKKAINNIINEKREILWIKQIKQVGKYR